MPGKLSNAVKRELKARAQRLEPLVRVGSDGMSEAFLKALDEALTAHQLVKIKFISHKEERKELLPQMAERTGSELIMQVGHVAVFYRPPVDKSD